MFAFFDFIVELVSTIIDFVINCIQMWISMLTFVAQGVLYLVDIVGHLPPFITPFVYAVVYWSLTMLILSIFVKN